MNLIIHNTLTGENDVFKPIKNGEVGMYHCGPTVYDFPHIGNMRAYVLADLIRRWFEHESPRHPAEKVKQVINITDVGHLTGDNSGNADSGDDKIEKRARDTGVIVSDIVNRYTDAFFADLESLNIVVTDTIFPKASEHISEQIELIKKLEELGYTYQLADGIYFDTARFSNYGKLGNIDIKGLKEGARIEGVVGKRNLTDFALWKFSNGTPRLQEWDPAHFGATWPVGFPGWHIECSAMSMKYLGNHFDIHTGGIDHIPVHHNNEMAQSEAALPLLEQENSNGAHASDGAHPQKSFVNYWLHSAFINVDGTKISKSLGNTVLVNDIIAEGIDPLAYKYFLLSAHYSTPVNFTWDALRAAEKALNSLRTVVNEGRENGMVNGEISGVISGKINTDYYNRFEDTIAKDFSTPQAIAILWELTKDSSISKFDKAATIVTADALLGLKLEAAPQKSVDALKIIDLQHLPEDLTPEIRDIILARSRARTEKNWKEADRLRDLLTEKGFEVRD